MKNIQNLKILLVEDHNLVRQAFRLMLLDLGVKNVIEAVNGEEAVEMTEQEIPDLILMDLMLPLVDGIDATVQIRKFNNEVKILAVTLHSDEQILKKAIESGLDGLLLKNSEAIELKKAIETVMTGRKFIDSNSAEILFSIVKDGKNKSILSPKEREVLQFAADGFANKEIATKMNLAVYTVKDHWKSVFAKLGAKDRGHAISIAFRNKILE